MVVQIKTYQRTEGLRAIAPTGVKAAQSDLSPIAQGVSQIGDTAFEWQDEIDTAAAKQADNQYSELIRTELYDDQTGFMYSEGQNSLDRRQSVSERLEAEQKRLLEGLHPRARARAGSAMTARFQRSLQQVDQHTAGQRKVFLDSASEARVASSVSDAIYNPDQLAQSLSINRQEITDLAARNGWAPEVTALKLQESETAIHSGIIGRVAVADPVQALEYLRTNKDNMSGDEVARLESKLVPMVRERRGRDAGFAAAGGMPAYEHSTKIDYNMGPARPYAPNKPVLDVIGRSVEDVLGKGARVVVTSGQEGDKDQHGSNRHKTGNAADIQVVRPDGTVVRASDPDAALIAKAAASLGAKGIGWGDEYMGGNHFHIDLVEPGAGQSNTWGSAGKANRADVIAAMNTRGGGGINDLLKIQDPDEQAAAVRAYNMVTGAQEKQKRAVADKAVDDASALIARGGSASELTIEQIDALGSVGHQAMMRYEESLSVGKPITTDDTLYVDLFDDAANNPQKMIEANPAEWRDKLSDSDFKYFVKMRADLIAGSGPKVADEAGISEVRTASSTALKAAGLDKDFEAVSAFESKMLRWASDFALTEERAPTPSEINDRVNQMLVPLTINPKGLKRSGALGFLWDSGKVDAPQFQVDWEGSGQTADDDLTPEDIRDGRLKIDGNKIENQTIEWFAQSFQDRFNRAPSVSELVEGIIASGAYK